MRLVIPAKALPLPTSPRLSWVVSVARPGVEYLVHIGKALHGYPEDELMRHATGPDVALLAVDGFRASGRQHAVEHCYPDGRFGTLPC